jgi:hypothetical protein
MVLFSGRTELKAKKTIYFLNPLEIQFGTKLWNMEGAYVTCTIVERTSTRHNKIA